MSATDRPTYRERRAAKAERLREWADKRDAKAEAARETTDRIAGTIPLGQPILVGHHSERRHRRDLDRIDRGMRATVENGRKADEFRSRADNIESAAERAVYSDDPDAAERLAERIAGLEAERSRLKAYNASVRKASGKTGDLGLLDEAQRRELVNLAGTGFLRDDGTFPPFKLSNLGGNIGRLRKRLAELEGGS